MTQVRPTLRRRILRLVPNLGTSVIDVAPGVALLTRRTSSYVARVTGRTVVVSEGLEAKVTVLGAGAAVVSESPHTKIRKMRDGGAIVTSKRAHRSVTVGRDLHLVGPAALFAGKDRATRDKTVSDWLASQHLRDIVWRYKVDVVLDVGANRGQYAKRLRESGYRGLIVSFEPVPDIFADLAIAAADDDLWHVHQMGLGSRSGELAMHVVPGTMSSMLPPSEFGTRRYEQLRDVTLHQVPVRRLDEILPQVLPEHLEHPRMLLKMDTQGFDLETFAGLGDQSPLVVAMQSEVALLTIYDHMPRMPEALAIYESAGFEITGMYPVTRERRTGRVLEYDCTMVRANAM